MPDDYRMILTILRAADGPVQVRAMGEELGLEVAVRGKLEPLRRRLGFVGLDDSGPDADPAVITGYKGARNPHLTRGQKLSSKALAAVRTPVEHGFAHLKNGRILGKVRTDPKWATALVRAMLVLTNREVSR